MLNNPWHTPKPRLHLAYFNCVEDMWRASRDRECDGSGNSSRTGSETFTETSSFEEAFAMGTSKGWVEGATQLRQITARLGRVNAILAGERITKSVSVAGPVLHPQRFIAGDKRHMTRKRRIRTADGTKIRLGVECATLGHMQATAYMTRGVAIAALVKVLENSGISVEVTGLWTSYDNKGDVTSIVANIKKAGVMASDERMAMCMAHPSTFRRGCFGIKEARKDFDSTFGCGYGSTTSMPEKYLKDLGVDHHIKDIHSDGVDWDSASDDEIVVWIRSTLDKIKEKKGIKSR
jgi:hypothetical protein